MKCESLVRNNVSPGTEDWQYNREPHITLWKDPNNSYMLCLQILKHELTKI